MRRARTRWRVVLCGVGLLALFFALPQRAGAFAFTFTNTTQGVDAVVHPKGYTGTGNNQHLTISVGILAGTPHTSEMVTPVQNVIRTWNGLVPTMNNMSFNTGVPNNMYDFESVLLHEVGHTLGLDHPHLGDKASPDPLDPNARFTSSFVGADGVYTFNAGPDGVRGTRDDVRGDDVNLNYFRRSDNNPFAIGGVVDKTTYSRNLNDLPDPTNNKYSAAATREVAASLGLGTNTNEAAMGQVFFFGEARRSLSFDDVAGIRYARSGFDEQAGNADDYTFTLTYAGITNSADILIRFDNSQTGFAFAWTNGNFFGDGHVVTTTGDVYFNTNQPWFFNQVSNVPEPGSLALMGVALAAGIGLRLRRRRAA